ncbi:hypothetical protein GCM10010329_19960 [Streptomyces spiroverticillatus]|uniref:Uncharacterized protein n=1 Tax=Streptomyces finlayi TaxID=67296 RepID=A0A918WU45_9ACTN|nr:hypothetical protein [Streptomyces finlayi]GGZ98468.1 hypothetical protein GCM10010329_19960 [Streptomyces spiroverticillatus]GHC83353.1 hypothetical protein GCM10010334_12400 [Streptomyces finlayi]
MTEYGDEAAAQELRELRELLERGTPRPTAPVDRMERVRAKVVRRRQRRTAGAAALTLAGIAVAASLVPGPAQDGPVLEPSLPAASRGIVPQPASTDWSPPDVPKVGLTEELKAPSLAGLLLRTPRSWRTSVVQGPPALAFAGPPGTALPDGEACDAGATGRCAPDRDLPAGGVLVSLRLRDALEREGRNVSPGSVQDLRGERVAGSCRVMEGTRELVVWYATGRPKSSGASGGTSGRDGGDGQDSQDGRDGYLEARACLRGPSPQRLAEAGSILKGITFQKTGTPGNDPDDSHTGHPQQTKGTTK